MVTEGFLPGEVLALPRFLLDPVPTSGVVVLAGAEGHHAARVQRLRVGGRLVVTDGRGAAALAEIVAVDRDVLQLHIDQSAIEPAPARLVTVVQALPKGDRGELAVELMTELGVTEIVPWSATRCVTVWRGERGAKALAKWRCAAVAAAKQSRRAWFPVVSELADTADVAQRIASAAAARVLHEAASTPFDVAELPDRGELLLIVGPEGGLTDAELAEFAAAGAAPVQLGRHVLRTSTAGAAALAGLL